MSWSRYRGAFGRAQAGRTRGNVPRTGSPVPGGPALYSLLMALFGRSRSRPAKDAAARDLFERLRVRYFQITPGLRFLGGLLLMAYQILLARRFVQLGK